MPRVEIESEKARQGRNGPRVLIVLICGLLLAMLVWWGVETYGVSIAPETPADGLQTEQNTSP